jgi:hypothetical protein
MFRNQKRTTEQNHAMIADGGIALTANLLPHGPRVRLSELSLVAAIFEDAVRCVHRASRGVTHRQFLDAVEWIASERGDWPFAFIHVCGFSAGAAAVRKRLRICDERVERGSRARVTRMRMCDLTPRELSPVFGRREQLVEKCATKSTTIGPSPRYVSPHT